MPEKATRCHRLYQVQLTGVTRTDDNRVVECIKIGVVLGLPAIAAA